MFVNKEDRRGMMFMIDCKMKRQYYVFGVTVETDEEERCFSDIVIPAGAQVIECQTTHQDGDFVTNQVKVIRMETYEGEECYEGRRGHLLFEPGKCYNLNTDHHSSRFHFYPADRIKMRSQQKEHTEAKHKPVFFQRLWNFWMNK